MANPRNIVERDGNAALDDWQTYETDWAETTPTIVFDRTKVGGSAQVGLAVTLLTPGKIQLAADGDRVLGRLDGVEADNKARVQMGGYMTLPGGASATLTVGLAIVGALGAAGAKGYIRVAASGTAAELVKCRGWIEDATTTTAVKVCLK